jgi:ATP-binding cassette subfamily B protein
MKALQHLNKYFYKYRYRLIVGIIITIVAKVFALFTPRLIGASINVVSDRLDGEITNEVFKTELMTNILYLLGAAIIAGLFTFLMRQTIINVSRYIEYDLKNEIYQHYQVLSLNFYKSNRTGDLMNRISEDVGKVRMYVGPAIMYTMNTITLFVVALIYMINAAPKLTLYTLLPLPILSVAIYKLSRLINQRSTIVQESLSTLSTY